MATTQINFDQAKAFPFTEPRLEELMRLIRAGRIATKADGRRWYRDESSDDQLYVAVGQAGGIFYRVAKIKGRKTYRRIGDATHMRVSVARDKARKLAAGNDEAGSAPIRIRTDGESIQAAWDAYLADARDGKFIAGKSRTRESTLNSYLRVIDPHVLRPYGKKTLHWLAKHVPEIIDSLYDRPAAFNRLYLVSRILFNHAIGAGTWEGINPLLDPRTGGRVRKKRTVASRERYLLPREAAAVLTFSSADRDPWPIFWKLLILTGVRVTNLRLARWEEFDLGSDATWQVPMTKNNRPLSVPLVDTAAEILRARLASVPKDENSKPIAEWVFPCPYDPAMPMRKVCHAWDRVREATGIKNVRIHDLRRTAGSWAVQEGASLSDVGKLLGHSSSSPTMIYARADMSGARRAAQLVEKRLLEALAASIADPRKPR